MIDVADLMAWLGNPGEPEAVTVIEALEGRAVEIIERETGRYFRAPIEHVEVLRGDGSTLLWLRERPTEIDSVEERARPGEEWTEVPANRYEVEVMTSKLPTPARLRHASRWRADCDYRVTYQFGYAAGQEPGDIRQAVIDLVALKYQERGRGGLRSETIGDYSYTRMSAADLEAVPEIARTVARWRGMVVA